MKIKSIIRCVIVLYLSLFSFTGTYLMFHELTHVHQLKTRTNSTITEICFVGILPEENDTVSNMSAKDFLTKGAMGWVMYTGEVSSKNRWDDPWEIEATIAGLLVSIIFAAVLVL